MVRETAVPLALVGERDAWRDHGDPAECEGDVRGLRDREPAVAPARAAADDARPDPADDDLRAAVDALCQGRGDGQALDVGVEARATAIVVSEKPPRLERPHRVRERDRERASGELDVRDATPGEGGAGGRELAVEAEADDRDVVDPLEGRVVVLLGVPVRELPGRVRAAP